jgi:alkylated DNA repair protein (DNA oxidative demethylase)
LSLHQDKDEYDLPAPIVSVSQGLPAVFQFGGLQRNAPTQRGRLAHGDMLVWGAPARLPFHGVLPLADGHHPLLERRRVNLTFRLAR